LEGVGRSCKAARSGWNPEARLRHNTRKNL
jgi:hypothetical protein